MSVGKASIKRALGVADTPAKVEEVKAPAKAEAPAKKPAAKKAPAKKAPAKKAAAPKKAVAPKMKEEKAAATPAPAKISVGEEMPYYLL